MAQMLLTPSQSKKARETIKAQLCISPRGRKYTSWRLPIGWKIKMLKCSNIIYQSIAAFMFFQKNIKIISSISTGKNPLGQNRPQGLPLGWKMMFSKYGYVVYQSIENFMYFLKNITTMCSKSTENLPQGKTALTDIYASTTALTQYSTSESCFFVFSASGAVLFTSTLTQFLTRFGCFCYDHPYGWSSIPPKLAPIG